MGDAGYILAGPIGREVLSFGTIVFAVFATGTYTLQISATTFYTLFAAIIYVYHGPDIASPAFTSLPLKWSKSAYANRDPELPHGRLLVLAHGRQAALHPLFPQIRGTCTNILCSAGVSGYS
ncbi:MAG: hypothetical protein Q9182_001077 [Xanthomendoza sp. 2 TL-2023]